jgi:hypothetical protein
LNKTLPVEAQQVSQPLPKRGQNQSTSQLQIIKTRHVKKKQKKQDMDIHIGKYRKLNMVTTLFQ